MLPRSALKCTPHPAKYSRTEEFTFNGQWHAAILLSELSSLRETSKLCDVTLQVDGKDFPAHKCILSALSPYFKGMFENEFLESKQNIFQLEYVSAETMESLINFAYTGKIKITFTNYTTLLAAADYFTITSVIYSIREFMETHLHYSNCLEIFTLAERYSFTKLAEKAFEYALTTFLCLINCDEFLELSADNLVKLTSSEKLNVKNEEIVLHAVMRWFKKNADERTRDLYKVLQSVRLPLVDSYLLHDLPHLYPALREQPKLMEVLEEAKRIQFLPDSVNAEIITSRTKPRDYFNMMQVLGIFGGCSYTGKVSSSAECYCPRTNRTYLLKNFPFTLSGYGIVCSGKNIFIAGGRQNEKVSQQVWKYDSVTNYWRQLTAMHEFRSGLGLAAVDGYIYAVGGTDAKNVLLDSVERYSQVTNTWSFVNDFKTPIKHAIVISYDRKIYVAGGLITVDDCHIGTDSFYRYDPKEDTWTQLSPMLQAKYGAAGCALDGFIYVIGGCYTKTVQRYDVKKNRWEKMSPINLNRGYFNAAVIDKKIYVLGGLKIRERTNNPVECYDPEINKWQIVGKLSSCRQLFFAVPFNIQKSYCTEVYNDATDNW